MEMKRKRILALMFTFIFIVSAALAGCTKTENKAKDSGAGNQPEPSVSVGGKEDADTPAADTSNAKGRYIETQITMPEGFSAKGNIRRLADGSLVLVDAACGTKSISEDNGKTWETEVITELERIMGRDGAEFTSTALTEDG